MIRTPQADTRRCRLQSLRVTPGLPGSSDVICGIRATAPGVHPQAKRGSSTAIRVIIVNQENKPESDSRCASPARRFRVGRVRGLAASIADFAASGLAPAAWRLAVFPMRKPLLVRPPLAIVPIPRSYRAGKCSQGGVKLPTGGKGEVAQARERLPRERKGQQIRCDSEADGESPDERERSRPPHLPLGASFRRP